MKLQQRILMVLRKRYSGGTMTNKDKAQMIQAVIDHPGREKTYYSLLEDLGDLKGNYADYMTTEPINCNEELQRVKNADYGKRKILLRYP